MAVKFVENGPQFKGYEQQIWQGDSGQCYSISRHPKDRSFDVFLLKPIVIPLFQGEIPKDGHIGCVIDNSQGYIKSHSKAFLAVYYNAPSGQQQGEFECGNDEMVGVRWIMEQHELNYKKPE